MRFVWDSWKNSTNVRKHGVSFEEAQTVFYDEYARLISDPDHSTDEDRFVLMGRSFQMRLLIVCHCYRENDEVIRVISARKANRFEEAFYKG